MYLLAISLLVISIYLDWTILTQLSEREDRNEHTATKGKSSTPWLCWLQALNPTFRASLDNRTCSGSKGAEVQVKGTADTLTRNKHELQSLCKRLHTCPTILHFLFFHTLWRISQTPSKQWDFCLCPYISYSLCSFFLTKAHSCTSHSGCKMHHFSLV